MWYNHFMSDHISSLNIYFTHIPKTAGSSMIESLRNQGGGINICAGHMKFYPNNSIKIVSIRNPYDRLVSAYYFMLNGGCNVGPDKEISKYLVENYNTFELFVHNFSTDKKLIEWCHFIPASTWVCNTLEHYDHIIRYEHLADDWSKFCDIYHLQNNLGWMRLGEHKHYVSLYTPEMVDVVKEFYHDDFVNLGYSESLT
jgi:hypothetical protein